LASFLDALSDALILPFLSLFLSGTASLDGKERLPAPGDRFRSAFSAPPAKI
jgi:hypothetical protein